MCRMGCESDMKEEKERERKRIKDLEEGMRNENENGDL